ncbi:hypothetical protein BASA81_012552 [Batrachochytrium salamandrivorans]|nr:hypothetical protein BASA81_012552 [Batrachochytrium salamandrivorans]
MEARFALASHEDQRLLRRAGFTKVSEVLKLPAADLSRELGVDLSRSLALLQELRGSADSQASSSPPSSSCSSQHLQLPPAAKNCTELIRALASVRHITTCCMTLDNLLGGGVPRSSVTEICGAPGAGKTQISMQLAVACAIPEPFGGVAGKTLYLDTEGSFSPQRVFDMAEATSRHLHSLGGELTTEQIMNSIIVARAHDLGEMLAFAHSLVVFLKQDPSIKLVVIDSIAHHFRHDFADFNAKNRTLAKLAALLNQVSREFDVAIVVINHMTTTTTKSNEGGLHPALGETWFHAVTNRLVLQKHQELVTWEHASIPEAVLVPIRTCELVKSSSLCCGVGEFVVVKIGIRQRPRAAIALAEAKRVRI